jgi:hypothetical protein
VGEGDNGKSKAAPVVQIADHRTSTGGKEEPNIPPAPKDRNEQVKPVAVNRNQVDPLLLIRAGKGTSRDRDRALLGAVDNIAALNDATQTGFFQVTAALQSLATYLRADAHRRARFWRRWFTRRPAVPDLSAVMTRARQHFIAQTQPAPGATEQPS